MLLCEMREVAEAYLDKKVKDVVLSVPACFDYCQRQAMRDAAAIAELNVLRFINGSTATSIAHGIDTTKSAPRNVLVFDCGGGTLDVSLVVIEDGIFEVKATAGDTHLGGMHFDNLLVQYFLDELKRKLEQDLKCNDRAMIRLREACEQAKQVLSASTKAYIELDALYDGVNFKSTIARTRYENLCRELLAKMLYPVEKVLRDAKMAKTMVDEVVATKRIQVFEGKTYQPDSLTYKLRACRVLCELDVTGITCGVATAEISFDVGVNGILQVSVVDESTGEMKQVTIESGRLPALQIERMREGIKNYRDIGVRNKLRAESKTALKTYVDSVRSSTAKRVAELKRSIELVQAVEHKATETLQWLNTNRSAEKEELDAKRQKLEKVVNTTGIESNTGGETKAA